MSVYVYGVVRAEASAPRQVYGVGEPPEQVRAVRGGKLAALVSRAPDGLRARRKDLQAHQNVLATAGAQGPVLPTRFGTVVADEDAVRMRLKAGAEQFAAGLDRVAGRVEMNLKVKPSESEDGLAWLLRQDGRLWRLREQARARPAYEVNLRLGQAVVHGLRRQAAAAGAEAGAELAALADATSAGPESDTCVLNISFLVAADQADRFAGVAGVLARRLADRAELRVTGPLPCYSFAGPAQAPSPARGAATTTAGV
jgi:hypothetical protein